MEKNDIKITNEYKQAFELLENSNQNVFLTGKAGTGKSTFLKYFLENTKKKYVLLGSTGVAANNIGGCTIHSYLSNLWMAVKTHNHITLKEFEKVELIIIDEASMVKSDFFDKININFKRLIKAATRNDDGSLFGGKQILLIGDLYQLPPVVSKFSPIGDYESEFFFSSNCYKEADFKIIELTKVMRQNDEKFISALNNIREGLTHEADGELFRTRIVEKYDINDLGVYICATNAKAQEINNLNLDKLEGPDFVYTSTVTGVFCDDSSSCIFEKEVILKKGAKVMMLINDLGAGYVNGTMGIVEDLNGLIVRIKLETGKLVEVTKYLKKQYEDLKIDEEEKNEEARIIGTFEQIPLKLAYAVTIHKAQGSTFDNVTIDIDKIFSPGQTYVALSRCRTLEGIKLISQLKKNAIFASQHVKNFYSGQLKK